MMSENWNPLRLEIHRVRDGNINRDYVEGIFETNEGKILSFKRFYGFSQGGHLSAAWREDENGMVIIKISEDRKRDRLFKSALNAAEIRLVNLSKQSSWTKKNVREIISKVTKALAELGVSVSSPEFAGPTV